VNRRKIVRGHRGGPENYAPKTTDDEQLQGPSTETNSFQKIDRKDKDGKFIKRKVAQGKIVSVMSDKKKD